MMMMMMVWLQVCLAAVGLVCDLCRALMSNILPYCDEIMQLLLENLGVRKKELSPSSSPTFPSSHLSLCTFVISSLTNCLFTDL